MSALKAKIQTAITAAMKAREAARLQALRNLMNVIRKKEIDDRKDLNDAEVEKVLMNTVKQLQESLDQAKAANRAESIAETEAELAVTREFLPKAMTEEEIGEVVRAEYEKMKAGGTLPPGNAGMGLLMKASMAVIGARADGKVIQNVVKKVLG